MYMLEQARQMADENGVVKCVVIWDREGYDKGKNFDKELNGEMKGVMKKVKEFYFELIENVYVLNVNWFFRMMI